MTAKGPPLDLESANGAPSQRLWRDRNLHVIFGVTLMAVLGVSSVTPAFPKVVTAFHIAPHAVGLLVTVFTLPGVVLAPVFGVLADRWGRKQILIPSLLLFCLAGVACGFAPSFHILVLLRFVQGIGAAALGSLNVTIIGDLFSARTRSTAMGYNASVLSVGTAAYPAIGGALALIGWNYPFFLPVLALPVGLGAMLLLKNPGTQRSQSLNAYLRGIMRSFDRRVAGLFVASTVTFILLYGSLLTHLPLLIEHRWHGSPLAIGLVMSSMSIVTAVTASQLGRLTKRFSERGLIAFSFLLYGAGLLLVPHAHHVAWLVLPACVYGVGHGINIPGIQTSLTHLAPPEHRAAFMAANGMVLRLGQTLGPLLMGAAFGMWGVDAPFFLGGALAVLMAATAWLFVR